jgi:hypothetical protein
VSREVAHEILSLARAQVDRDAAFVARIDRPEQVAAVKRLLSPMTERIAVTR